MNNEVKKSRRIIKLTPLIKRFKQKKIVKWKIQNYKKSKFRI